MTLVLRARVPYHHGLLRRINENRERFLTFRWAQAARDRGVRHPQFSIRSGADSISFSAELPDTRREGIDVSASEGALVVRGNREYEQAVERVGWRYSENGTRNFSRIFPLPDNADWEATAASYDDGVLTITVPLKAAAEPRRIEVRAAEVATARTYTAAASASEKPRQS